MKHYIIFISLLLIITCQTTAQDYQTPYEIKGTELMQKAGEKLRSYKTMIIEFTYEMENTEMEIKEVLSGTLYIENDKYHMIVGNNFFISDGSTIWNYIEDMEEVQINNAADVDGDITPTSILDDFEEHFRATFIRQENYNGKRVDIVDLIPKVSQAFFKYRIALDAKSQMIVYSKAYDRHGGTYSYIIDKVEINPNIPANKFIFDASKYPDIFINDLR